MKFISSDRLVELSNEHCCLEDEVSLLIRLLQNVRSLESDLPFIAESDELISLKLLRSLNPQVVALPSLQSKVMCCARQSA
jgi:hypothetical protein